MINKQIKSYKLKLQMVSNFFFGFLNEQAKIKNWFSCGQLKISKCSSSFAWLGKYSKWHNIWKILPETLKYWVGVQWSQFYLMGRRHLFSLGWSHFLWWYHNKNTLWGRCFMTDEFTVRVTKITSGTGIS